MTVHIVGSARNYLVLISLITVPITVVVAVAVPIAIVVATPAAPSAFDCEISPATVVHPDAPAVRAPTIAFPAGRLATLLHQANSSS